MDEVHDIRLWGFRVLHSLLDPMNTTPKSLRKLHDDALDELVAEGFVPSSHAERQKSDLRTAISRVG